MPVLSFLSRPVAKFSVATLLFAVFFCIFGSWVFAADPCPKGALKGGKDTKLIPLPVYATLPNEGDTWGFMPVFMKVCEENQRTESILAPSATWNQVIKSTATFRWFQYPTDAQTLTVLGGLSAHVNWNVLVDWQDLPVGEGQTTEEFQFMLDRSIFARFFGIGPETGESDETSYTRFRSLIGYRHGWNLTEHLNFGVQGTAERDLVERSSVPGYPVSPVAFPTTPGMGGGSILSQSLDLRYDTRTEKEYSERGRYLELLAGVVEGLAGGPTHARLRLQAKTLYPQTSRLSGATRLHWRYVTSSDVPFYYQSDLGGSELMRGFTEGRFVDRGAWTFEYEERIQLFRSHIYGVTADWRLDPFIAIGQVYREIPRMFSHVRVTGGLGFRAWVRPNVVGRVDIASSGHGGKVYVELGYPF